MGPAVVVTVLVSAMVIVSLMTNLTGGKDGVTTGRHQICRELFEKYPNDKISKCEEWKVYVKQRADGEMLVLKGK